ncbi:hypothetical protein AB3N04_15940 [Alkalihalophilus sp. As8PL]|uniref:Stage II sporulation protein B n=1 Tax=Alkalihalophilus sp. As8PL TaxID=3237103 RepID=A0AB39BRR6_9BACI
MDRDKRTISIRLNGEEKVFNESKDEITAARDERADDEVIEGVSIPQPDNVIDFNTVHTEREKRKMPFWDDGNRESGPKLPVNRKKKSTTSFSFSMPTLPSFSSFSFMPIAIILSAIIVGVSFGLVVLNVFTGGGESAGNAPQEATTGAIPTFQSTSSAMPSLAVEVIQGGAFSTVEKGKEMAEQFQASGLAAVLTDTTDPIYLFVGLGAERAEASSLAAVVEAQGQDTYLKTYQVSGAEVTNASEAAIEWYSDSLTTFYGMLKLTTDGLAKGGGVSVEQVEHIKQQLGELQQKRESAIAEVPESAQPSTLLMGSELDGASKHIASYVDTQDTKELWKAQQSLLRVLVAYEQVVALY